MRKTVTLLLALLVILSLAGCGVRKIPSGLDALEEMKDALWITSMLRLRSSATKKR